MGTTYDSLEVVVTLDPNGRIFEVEVPNGVILTIDRLNDAGEYETETFEGAIQIMNG